MNAVPRETAKEAARRLSAGMVARGYAPTALHEYQDADGNPLLWRIRCDHPTEGKWMRPMRITGSGYEIGEPASPPGGRALYRLPELLASAKSEPVWIVEGEKTAEALAALGLVVTTSGSSSSAAAADWSPLKGRRAVLWPDNDLAGAKYAEAVTGRLRALAVPCEIVDIRSLGLPEKGDCVDWLAANSGANRNDVDALPRNPAPAAKPAPKSVGPQLILTRGCDVQPVSVDWIWNGWLAAGKMHLIGGAPGTGKTTIATALAATVTQGGRWPDGTRANAGDIVIWSGEDDNADTLNPRLRAAGANMERVHVIAGVTEDGVSYPFDPARDMEALRERLAGLPSVRLLIVDPVVSAISGDSHKNAEVRRGLQPLVDLASELGCALLGVTHFSKGTSGRDPVERITGSLAFGALARLVMVAAKQDADGDSEERRVLLRAKSNIGPDGGGFVYDLQQGPLDGFPHIQASRVVWGTVVEGSARELLAEAEAPDGDRSATDEAMDILKDILDAGALPSAEAQRQARAAGASDKAIRTARERLGIRPQKEGFAGKWVWQLPKMPNKHEDAHSPEWASSGTEGIFGGEGSPEDFEV